MDNKQINWCFIFSLPRSGSTLLTVLLDKSKQCVVLPETHFFVFRSEVPYKVFESHKIEIITAWVQFYRTAKWISDREKLKERLIGNSISWKTLFEETVLHYIEENNIAFNNNMLVIEKSPPHLYFQQEIKKMMGDCLAIYLVRDPRAIVASLLGISWSTHNVYTLSRVWNRFVNEIGMLGNALTVRYETMVQENEKELQKIYQFLGLVYSNDVKGNSDFVLKDKINFDNPIHSEIRKPVNDKNIDKWKSILSKDEMEVQQIENVCKNNMLKYNYALTTTNYTSFKTNLLIFLNAIKLMIVKILK